MLKSASPTAGLQPANTEPFGDVILRKLTAIIAALGFLATTSLTPVFAAQAIDTPAKSDDRSAAKKKKTKKAKRGKRREAS